MNAIKINVGASTTREAITKRVRGTINSMFSESLCFQVALACATREPESVLGFILPHSFSKSAIHKKSELKLTLSEWKQIFHYDKSPTVSKKAVVVCESREFVEQSNLIENAFKLTLHEQEQSSMWKKPWHRLVLYIALHVEFSDEAITSCLGSIIKQDQRRIEDLVNKIDDVGMDTLSLANSLEAVSDVIICC